MGRRLHAAREELELTQPDVAKLVTDELNGEETVGQSMISRYERGNAVPEPPKRRALEKVLGLDPGELDHTLEPERRPLLPALRPDQVVVLNSEDYARIDAMADDISSMKRDVEALLKGLAPALRRLGLEREKRP